MITLKCQKCGKEFGTYSSRIKVGKGKFCSKKCYWLSLVGWVFTDSHRRKLSVACTKERNPFWNKKHSETSKDLMRLGNKGKHLSSRTEFKKGDKRIVGENNPNWNGGKSFEKYTVNWTSTLKRAIRERDKYTCRVCGLEQTGIAFSVHHIDYDKKNCNPDNLVTLCLMCHLKTNGNRKHWTDYFRKVVTEA
jgi:endogenous inhibitor of DNA gyrase (YacG/DUF329 family)